jgi:hypothetical protein
VSPTEQRRAAVIVANDHRLARQGDKHRIRRRELRVSEVVQDPPDHWRSALLYDLMLAAPRFGRHKLRAFNAAAVRQGVNVCAPVGDLAPLQRAWTVAYLRERGL